MAMRRDFEEVVHAATEEMAAGLPAVRVLTFKYFFIDINCASVDRLATLQMVFFPCGLRHRRHESLLPVPTPLLLPANQLQWSEHPNVADTTIIPDRDLSTVVRYSGGARCATLSVVGGLRSQPTLILYLDGTNDEGDFPYVTTTTWWALRLPGFTTCRANKRFVEYRRLLRDSHAHTQENCCSRQKAQALQEICYTH